MTLSSKIPPDKTTLTTAEVVETMRQFKELYQALQSGDLEQANKLYQESSPEITEILEGLVSGPYSLVPEEEQETINDSFREINAKLDIVSKVKLALVGTNDTKDFIKKHLGYFVDEFDKGNKQESLKHLGHVRSFIFPVDGESPVNPEDLNPEFVDFLDDKGMWEWIAEKEKSGLSESDEEGLAYIHDSVTDFLDGDKIFSDLNVYE